MPKMPRAYDRSLLLVDSEMNSTTMPPMANIKVGIQIVGDLNSIFRTATFPAQMLRKAVRAATTPSQFI